MKPPPGYTGHARDFAKGEVVPDPKVEITPNVKLLTRVDGMTVIFDRRLPLGENAGVYADANEAELGARKKYAHEIGPKAAAKQSASDEELFAGMKRAAARGFAPHEPAYTPEELAEHGVLTVTRVDTVVGSLSDPVGIGKAGEYLRAQKSPDAVGNRPSTPLITIATEEDVTRFVSLDELFGDEPVTSVDALEPPARAVVSSYERDDVATVPCCAAPCCALDCVCACHDDEPPRLE